MANRGQLRSRGSNRRQRNAKRNVVRTVSRAIHFKPLRARLSNDPPPIVRTSSGSTIVPIMISVGAAGTPAHFQAGTTDYFSYLQLGANENMVLQAAGLTGADISNALFAWMQWNTGNFETSWALRKVCLWGPNPLMGNVNYQNTEIGLRVDLGDISNALELHDGGTTTRRPAVAISLPYSIWYDAPGDALIHIFPDATDQKCPLAQGYIWGKLYLSLDWRRTPSTVLAASRNARSVATTTTTTEKPQAGGKSNR